MTQKKPEKQTAKISTTSPDMNAERLAELRRLFPDLFDGEGQLDEKALRQIVQPDQSTGIERFRFEWAGKQDSKRHAFTPSKATLVADKKRSVDFDDTQNLIIEGDNLEALKLLQATYFEQVKCIYIDPPYNTTNDFIYPDDYTESKKAYWQKNGTVKDGVKLVANSEAAGRKHSNWLNMMQSRLLAARHLLRRDGVIFVSIDDHEDFHLRKLMNEVFGEENFAGRINWRRRHNQPNDKTKMIAKVGESIFAYFKDIESYKETGVGKVEVTGTFSNPDDDARGDWASKPWKVGTNQNGSRYSITTPTGKEYNEEWMGDEDNFKSLLADNRIVFTKNGDGFPRKKYFKSEREEEGQCATNWWPHELFGHNQEASAALSELLGGKNIFDNPKPVRLVKSLIDIGFVENNDIVMDFFAGSGTTAEAVFEQQASGINMKFILVQVPEFIDETEEAFKAGYKKISDVCIERVKRAGEKISREHPKAKGDTGFRVYRLTDSHFPENLFKSDPDKSDADNMAALQAHLETASQTSLFKEDELADIITEISLKNGYGLFFTLEQIKDFKGNTVYRLSGNGKDALLCLDETLKDTSIETLAADHAEDQLIVTKRALDTAKTWTLQNAFGDNLRVV